MKRLYEKIFHQLLSVDVKYAHVARHTEIMAPFQNTVDTSVLITEGEVQDNILLWHMAIGETSGAPLSKQEKERRVVAIMDEYIGQMRSSICLSNTALDFAIFSFLIRIGINSAVTNAVAGALYDDSLFESNEVAAALDSFCHYVYHELEQDPFALIYRYRTP